MLLKRNQLSRLTVSGYKSIRSCDISFNKINVLIGSNGAGKSNFVSVFSLLQSVLSQNLQIFTAQNGMNSLLYKGRKVTDEISVEVYFGKNSYAFVLLPTDDNRLIFKNEHFGCYGSINNEISASKGNRESGWHTGTGCNIDDQIMPILVRQNWRVYHFNDTGRDSRIKQEHNISNNKALMNDASNLAAFLYRLKQNFEKSYQEILNTIQLIAPYFSDFILEPQEGNPEHIILKWQQKGCDDIFNASQLSDGTLRFICLATLLLQPLKLQPATIIIDEPELGLHPYAITIFAEMVKQLSEEKQIIISTQSVEMLNEFDVEDIIVTDSNETGSHFKRLGESELEIWLKEDYALGDLWKKNILGGRL